jgi:eukaryotic-like serine/threonine-protein kinase
VNLLSLFRSTTPEPLLGGRYKIISNLGSGGFGQTFLAEDLHLPGHPRCVIKRLQPQATDEQSLQIARRLFENEANVLYQLGDHDQIPRLLAHFEEGDEFYLAQELIVGQPLSHELRSDRPWSEAQVVALLRDILGILVFVHEHKVIHRDIKPANLIRRHCDRKMVLIDFGAVKLASTQISDPNSKQPQTISIGTHGYMPNEQIAGNPRFSSDIYAVGMIGIQALTGVVPRQLTEDPRTGEIEWRHLVPDINSALADVLAKMVGYDFRTRYPSATHALTAIEQVPISTVELESAAVQDLQQSHITSQSNSTTLAGSTFPQDTTAAWLPTFSVPQLPTLSRRLTLPLRQTHSSKPSGKPAPPSGLPGLTRSGRKKHLTRQSALKPLLLLPVGIVALGAAAVMGANSEILFRPASQASSPLPVAVSGITAFFESLSQSEVLITKADQLREDQNFQEAIALYDQAIKLDDKRLTAYWGKCYSLNALAKFTEAIAACDTALRLQPDYPEALWSKGYALEQQEQYESALTLYEQAIALRPDFAEVWSNKGTALLRLQRFPESVEAFEQATRLNPNLAEAWNNRGVVLWNLRRFDEALTSVERAIQIQPDYQDALSLQQQMRQQIGK